jgi:hypothetical protein
MGAKSWLLRSGFTGQAGEHDAVGLEIGAS